MAVIWPTADDHLDGLLSLPRQIVIENRRAGFQKLGLHVYFLLPL
jgi:hypothetical protein